MSIVSIGPRTGLAAWLANLTHSDDSDDSDGQVGDRRESKARDLTGFFPEVQNRIRSFRSSCSVIQKVPWSSQCSQCSHDIPWLSEFSLESPWILNSESCSHYVSLILFSPCQYGRNPSAPVHRVSLPVAVCHLRVLLLKLGLSWKEAIRSLGYLMFPEFFVLEHLLAWENLVKWGNGVEPKKR